MTTPAVLSLRRATATAAALVASFPMCVFAAAPMPTTVAAAAGSTARVLPIAGDGFAGSSVNVIAGLQNSLFTEGRTQYAAFYAADSTVVLARREIGQDTWESVRTQYKGNTADAHRTIALVVDGDGFLHVAWDHHANALNYCRSVAPGSLELGPKIAMTGTREDHVTYPLFLRLPDGDLLFFYRDGVSGNGNLALNRYETKTRTWRHVHDNLIDGEGKRNAYPSVVVDGKGTLHLAWTWRETPDVATNHDLCYAKSADGGATWTTSAGEPLALPIIAATAEYALRLPQNSSLMNPPSVAADQSGRALIADYWTPAGTNVPQYHLLRFDGTKWRVTQITHRTTSFVLAGTATKRPPMSRSVLLTYQPWRKPQEVYLIYRDDDRGGVATLVTCKDIAAPEWRVRDLTADSLGAWEPSYDPIQWQRFQQIHLLVQPVEQRDGDDRNAAVTAPSTVASLIWSPFLAGMAEGPREPLRVPAAGELDRSIVPADVLALMKRVADWQLAEPFAPGTDPRGWVPAPFYIGTLALAHLTADRKYHDAILAQAEKNKWEPASRPYDADDYCVTQAYAELYRMHRDPKMIAPSRAHFDAILAKPPTTSLAWGLPGDRNRWSWCDALFMGPTSWLMMAQATGDARYVDFAVREWRATTDTLYINVDGLYARDESFLDLREPNGRRLYWARGNGWVVAGLCRVIDALPANHPELPRFKAQYLEMMQTVLAAQQSNGLWRPGLLDPVTHTARETSGSSFMTFALAWGINRGLLDRASVEPAVRRGWHALADCVNASGKLEHVQPIGAAPEGFDPAHSEPFGVGAFLLAGSEVYRVAGGKPEAGAMP